MPDTVDPETRDRQARLLEALTGIADLASLPVGRVDTDPVLAALFASADDLARRSELRPIAGDVEKLGAGFSEAGQAIATCVRFRDGDEFLLGHADDALEVRRVEFNGLAADVPEVGARLRVTADGALLIESTEPDDEPELVLGGEIQLIVGAEDDVIADAERALELNGWNRGRDAFGLQGQFALSFELGTGMRAMWGAATITIGKRRILGVVFDHHIEGTTKAHGRESSWMPRMSVGTDISTVVAFSIPRYAVHDVELLDRGFFASRVPNANVHGQSFVLAIQTARVLQGEELVRPKKHQLGPVLQALPTG